MISGYCFNRAKHKDFLPFVEKRIMQLIIPCVLFTLISLAIVPEYVCEHKYNELAVRLPGALWFLPILFIIEILGWFICYKKMGILAIPLCLICANYLYSQNLPLIHHLTQIPMCLLYYMTGVWLRRYSCIGNYLRGNKYLLQYLSCGIVGCVLSYIYVVYDNYRHNEEILNYFELAMVGACFCAIVGVCSLAVLLVKIKINNLLSWFGKSTLVIMSVQGIFISVSDYFIRPLFSFSVYKSIQFLFVFGGCIVSVLLISKYMPVLAGKGFRIPKRGAKI